MKKLESILLVDDHEPINFLHKLLIQEYNLSENIHSVQTGLEAIQYLRTLKDNKYPCPDLILLDINMPVMNGWEFLEEYKELPLEQKGRIIIVMLTTSLNPDDRAKAEQLAEVKGFATKPLTIEKYKEIVGQFFKDEAD